MNQIRRVSGKINGPNKIRPLSKSINNNLTIGYESVIKFLSSFWPTYQKWQVRLMPITLEMTSHLYLLINRPMGKASCTYVKIILYVFRILETSIFFPFLYQTDPILFQFVSSLFKKFENLCQCIFKQIYVLQQGNLIINWCCVG